LNFVDLLAVVHVAFATWRGRKRGFLVELPSAVSITLFSVTGLGLFKWMYRGLSQVSGRVGQSVGLLTFAGLVVAAYVLAGRIRAYLGTFAEKLVSEPRHRLAGGITGGVRAFVLFCTLLLVLAHWPLHAMTRWIVEGSFLGRSLIRWVLPVYGKTHGAL
jgi:uncharacterized membrane protein required for colicin V production